MNEEMEGMVEEIKTKGGKYLKSVKVTEADGLEVMGVNGNFVYFKDHGGTPYITWEAYTNDGDLIDKGRFFEDEEWNRSVGKVLRKIFSTKISSEMIERVASGHMEAGIAEVTEKIFHRIRDSELAQRLIEKVKKYWQTGNPADDLTPSDTSMIYRPDDYGEMVPLSNKKKLDVEWSQHSCYRSDLRDIDPEKVNKAIEERLKGKLPHPDRNKVKMKEPGLGTIVMDYDMMSQPAEAEVITVWASQRESKIASRIVGDK